MVTSHILGLSTLPPTRRERSYLKKTPHVGGLPALAQFERSCKVARRAAAGPDGITGTMVAKLHRPIASLVFPLITRIFLRTTWPSQWKGVGIVLLAAV
eukprot:3488658-Pyramimonas_sp.AAC.1